MDPLRTSLPLPSQSALISILKSPSFSLSDITSVNWKVSFKELGISSDGIDTLRGDSNWVGEDGWVSSTISIEVPFHKRTNNPGVEEYVVGQFYHRPLLSVIKNKLANSNPATFHYYPYHASWASTNTSPGVETYGELYASRAFRQAHEELQRQPFLGKGPDLERVVVALMVWSDSTHLTSFGHASLWPCYLFFGNESKYERCKSSESLGKQIAYFIKLPDNFQDYLTERNQGQPPAKALKSIARSFSSISNGLVANCPDGKKRRFYPRLFTYSADYPERIIISGILSNGARPCYRCLIKSSDLGALGSPNDTDRHQNTRSEVEQAKLVKGAQSKIKKGRAVGGKVVNAGLKDASLESVTNMISTSLSPLGFELIPCLVADILHEFEIGVWKNLFVHLIRILVARRGSQRKTLDFRYRAIPSFGKETIRQFGVNASSMSRRAARDYEDLLQCAVPAFEMLLVQEDNLELMNLLYICAQWHALAKLRLHNDYTLDLLQYTTVRLGAQMRVFDRDVCSHYDTKELQKEADARARRDAKNGKSASSGCRKASLGVFTIKFHLLLFYGACENHFKEEWDDLGAWKGRVQQFINDMENDDSIVVVEGFLKIGFNETLCTLLKLRYSPEARQGEKYMALSSISRTVRNDATAAFTHSQMYIHGLVIKRPNHEVQRGGGDLRLVYLLNTSKAWQVTPMVQVSAQEWSSHEYVEVSGGESGGWIILLGESFNVLAHASFDLDGLPASEERQEVVVDSDGQDSLSLGWSESDVPLPTTFTKAKGEILDETLDIPFSKVLTHLIDQSRLSTC
ncbi:hypothetical protein NMY22_g19825 [Coprinellus aureogranulatus]|nr:hypothetical protein NMY22_g19825 [Coprinellus aureogranulatus]